MTRGVEAPATPRTKPFRFGLSLASPSQPQSLRSKPPLPLRKTKAPLNIKPAIKETQAKAVSFHIKPSIIQPVNTLASSVALCYWSFVQPSRSSQVRPLAACASAVLISSTAIVIRRSAVVA